MLKQFTIGKKMQYCQCGGPKRKQETRTNDKSTVPSPKEAKVDGDSTVLLGRRCVLLSAEQTPHHLLVVDQMSFGHYPSWFEFGLLRCQKGKR
jgi:hypothetical protein